MSVGNWVFPDPLTDRNVHLTPPWAWLYLPFASAVLRVRLLSFSPQLLQAPADLHLMAPVGGLIVASPLGQVGLVHPAALEVVAVLVILAPAQLFRTGIVGVAQVVRHGQGAAGADVVAGPGD